MNNLVLSNIFHRPMRTATSIFGIGIGTLLIVFTIGLANGSLRERASREANINAEILYRPAGSVGLTGSDSVTLPVSLITEIEKVEGVERAVSIIQIIVSAKDTNTGSRLIDGVNFDEYSAMTGIEVVKGRKFIEGSDEIMADTAWLQQKKLELGDTIEIYDRKFTFVGTYEPGAGGRTKISLLTMQKQILSENKASAFLVKIKDGFKTENVAAQINETFPDSQIILTKDLEELYMQSIPALNVFLNVVIGVAGVVSALIILLTMYTTVTERTRQIGILKSLGMSQREIAFVILQEAVLISVSGVLAGVLLTVILRFVLLKWTTLNVQIEPQVIFITVVMGIISSILGALYPALRAARLDAVDALNYE